ncbi:MAG: DNA polymerase III subunit delta [Prevotellaceae bacterium]|jgi:DNA polymerase-3 subunit delta'|nr:DNA polymerase III subunit delta [Prevotellaceae bacterium]
MQFSEIIGQGETKNRLIRSVREGKISHAQLFAGAEGVGKLPLAIAYAQYVCCTNRGENDSCGVCPSCVKFGKLAHPDLHFVFPVISSSVSDDFIKEWREIVTEKKYFTYNQWLAKLNAENKQALIYSKESEAVLRKLSMKSYESEYKVMIIWQPERMYHDLGFGNKLLKILEEPPERTLFVLVSENPDALMITIQSRTQRINIPAIAESDLTRCITERYYLSADEANNIARIAGGSYTVAIENIKASDESRENLARFIEIMRLAYSKNVRGIKQWADATAGIGRERQKNFLAYAQRMIRENFMLNFHHSELNYMTNAEQSFAQKFSPFINERNIFDIMEEFALAERHIEQNVNAKMVFFDLSLKFIVLLKR